MKKNIGLLFTVFLLSTFLFCSCDRIKNITDNLESKNSTVESASVRAENSHIAEVAKRYFPDNVELQKQWIERQMCAHDELSQYIPEISPKIYSEIRELSEAKCPDDFSERLRFVMTQSESYRSILKTKSSTAAATFEKAEEFARRKSRDNYETQLQLIRKWVSAISSIDSMQSMFSADEFAKISDNAYNSFPDKPESALLQVRAQRSAKYRFDTLVCRGKTPEAVADMKSMAAKKYPYDYVARVQYVKEVNVNGIPKDKDVPVPDDLRAKASRIFRESIFTTRGIENEIYSAPLVKMNGKVVILCTKEFIPEKFPVKFGNSAGTITCSKAYISDEYPIIMMVPDREPTEFTPIEIVDAADSKELSNRELYMIAPNSGGFWGMRVFVFSEDLKYLNLTADSAPRTISSTHIKSLNKRSSGIDVRAGDSVEVINRRGTNFLVSVSERVDIGDNSVVLDPANGKLVSIAVRHYNPGVLSASGKTGSIIGHEQMEIPDFTTFVRQFDGSVNKTYRPRSSLRFVRMTALDSWKALDTEKFAFQKNEVRKFTDDNNDFLMFFKNNQFNEALRSRRLGMIAERFRRPLLHERLSRPSFELQYRNYMLEVLYALKRELVTYRNPEIFYSVYRSELNYQLKLRNAMHNYLAEAVRDWNIVNILHTDLVSRYNNCGNLERVGGGIGGGY